MLCRFRSMIMPMCILIIRKHGNNQIFNIYITNIQFFRYKDIEINNTAGQGICHQYADISSDIGSHKNGLGATCQFF